MKRYLLRRPRGDDGQLLLLVLCYTLIAALLVTVVVSLSRAFLDRRALLSAADGAALAAANEPDLARLYDGADDFLPLSRRAAERSVEQYAIDAQLGDRFADFRVDSVTTDGTTVRVTFTAVVPLPFTGLLPDGWQAGYPFDATASARSPLTP